MTAASRAVQRLVSTSTMLQPRKPQARATDTAERRFEQSLYQGPSAAIEHFRTRWHAFEQSSSRSLEEDEEPLSCIGGICHAFGDRAASAESSELFMSEDVWRASVRTELPLLLVEIMLDDRFFLVHRVSLDLTSPFRGMLIVT